PILLNRKRTFVTTMPNANFFKFYFCGIHSDCLHIGGTDRGDSVFPHENTEPFKARFDRAVGEIEQCAVFSIITGLRMKSEGLFRFREQAFPPQRSRIVAIY